MSETAHNTMKKEMKIWCGVCEKEKASVFCSADEAALCDGCDRRVHHANKLASKHLRFSLVDPTSKESPLCDICQERRALVFCQEDRAILCRECDLPIHRANEHTKKHNRFLLTGVKLSASSSLYPNSSAAIDEKNRVSVKKKKTSSSVSNEIFSSSQYTIPSSTTSHEIGNGSMISTSSISEYLMETIPGWRVEDLLDPASSACTNDFCKTCDEFSPFLDQDLQSNVKSFSTEDFGFWVPEIPLNFPQNSIINSFQESGGTNPKKPSRKWSEENGFVVPQSHKKTRQHTFGRS